MDLNIYGNAPSMNMDLNDTDIVSQYVLSNDRKMFIDVQIDEELTMYERMILRWNMEDSGKPVHERKPIMIYIMSPGGMVDYMWSLVDVIIASETPVYTINLGICYSAAAEIFISGHKRFMFPHSKVLIHQGSNIIMGNAIQVIDQAEAYKTALQESHQFILEHTGITDSMLVEHKANDWTLSAEECLKYNVCDRVIASLSEVI